MIKRYSPALVLHQSLMRASADINDAVDRIWHELEDSERRKVRSAASLILGEIYVEGLQPLEHQHPMLIPEDRRIDPA